MHSRIRLTLLLLLVSLNAPASAASAEATPNSRDTDERVPFTANRRVKLGMTKSEVLSSMRGHPDERAATEIWVYWNFNDPRHVTAGIKWPAMVIFFTDGKATLLRILGEEDVRTTLAQYRQPAPAVGGN